MADLFAPVALITGGVAVLSSVVCCFDEIRDDEVALVVFGIIAMALWTGAYGLVMRGTFPGRLGAFGGFLLGVLAIVLGFAALCWHEGIDL